VSAARPPEGARTEAAGEGTPMSPPRAGTGPHSAGQGKDGVKSGQPGPAAIASAGREWPLWEVFIRSKQGLEHKHCGSLHAADARQALQMARDVYTRRQEGVSLWVVPSASITASEPDDKAEFFEPMGDKIYRHPTFYEIPDDVGHM
jgi:ring-1,2-phenylacetyl-CoA epoxidase subunit PaaB